MRKLYSLMVLFVCSVINTVAPFYITKNDLDAFLAYKAEMSFAYDVLEDATHQCGLLQEELSKVCRKHSVALAREDIDLLVSGGMRQEGFYFDKPLTFRDDYNDQYKFFRSRYFLDINATHGIRSYGAPLAEASARIAAYNVWDNFDVYVPVVAEPVSFAPYSFLKKAEIAEHHHDVPVTQAYLEEGWVRLHLDHLLQTLAPMPLSLMIGYFKYQVGRGVSLGSYIDGGIGYLGWKTPGRIGNNPNGSPGILLRSELADNCALELYYLKWRKLSHGPDFTREEVSAQRLDINDESAVDLERGSHADRNLYAARLLVEKKFSDKSSLSLEPYLVHVDAPELEIEYKGDASARLTTIGCMAEYQKNGWSVNAEVAAQYGYHDIHAIDRNHLVMDDQYYLERSTVFSDAGAPDDAVDVGRLDVQVGKPVKYNSHILLGARPTSVDEPEFLPYRSYYVSDELRHINDQRSVALQGDMIRAASAEKSGDPVGGSLFRSAKYDYAPALGQAEGGQYGGYRFKTGIDYYDTVFALLDRAPSGHLFNANIPFGGGQRFRPGYRLDCRGVMAMIDVSYTSQNRFLTWSCAAAHVSGDEYPLNEARDKTYHGFIPLKDADYSGRNVKSYAMLKARKIGRPTSFSDHHMYAPVETDTMNNLQYVGTGVVLRPTSDRRLVEIELNTLLFWEDVAPYKWDLYATRNFGNSKMNSLYAKAQSDLHFTGDTTGDRASAVLGYECNIGITWRPVPCCQVWLMGATFVPGKLYEDIKGMPTAYTVRQDVAGDWRFDGFGTQIPIGGVFRVSYWF